MGSFLAQGGVCTPQQETKKKGKKKEKKGEAERDQGKETKGARQGNYPHLGPAHKSSGESPEAAKGGTGRGPTKLTLHEKRDDKIGGTRKVLNRGAAFRPMVRKQHQIEGTDHVTSNEKGRGGNQNWALHPTFTMTS